MSEQESSAPATRRGPGRVLIAVYAVFAIGATTRAIYQLLTRFDEAPVAYLLSLVAAVVYVVITVALIKGTPTARRVARIGIVVELVGVLVVGTISLLLPDYFPRATVWSSYGLGYLLIPLILPILGLWFLRSTEGH
jgi:EamA domain-containing membrane protein RarD